MIKTLGRYPIDCPVEGTALILGCGHKGTMGFPNAVTIDMNPQVKPDVVMDLSSMSMLPFDDNKFDRIIAIQILEHLGQQGDYRNLFAQFSEYWRILKPGGELQAAVPHWNSIWAWGDPSHRRIINPGTLVFFSQAEYKQQQAEGRPMTDYRWLYKADFDCIEMAITPGPVDEQNLWFKLRAIKPSRIEE